jgi:hypothetical protein
VNQVSDGGGQKQGIYSRKQSFPQNFVFSAGFPMLLWRYTNGLAG